MSFRRWFGKSSIPSRNKNKRTPRMVETLEDRSTPATITGGTAAGGFELANGASPLQLWLDASDVDGNGAPDALADGSTVATWTDKSGFGHNALQVRGTPAYVLASGAGNNKPSIGFNVGGASFGGSTLDELDTPYNFDNLGANYSIFAVSRYTGGSDQRVITSVGHNWLYGHWSGGDQRWYAEGWIQQSGTASQAFNVYSGIIGPGVPNADFWKNGTQLNDNSTGFNGGNYKPGQLALGSWNGGGESSNAEISEIIIIDRNVNEAERRVIENALNAKYIATDSILAPAQDVYRGRRLTVDGFAGDFDLQVFGIGRVNSTNQLLSAGQAGFGIEATSLSDDGDFVMAGHKTPTNAFTTLGIPAGVARRWSRSWYVDVTDGNDNVGGTLAFDYSDAGLAIGSANTFKLLRSTDGGGSWTDVGVAFSRTGDQIRFNLSAAELSNGLYTLGDSSGPQVATTPSNQTYALDLPPVTIDNGMTIATPGDPTIVGATVTVSSGFTSGDTFAVTLQPGISVVSNTGGTLTLTGNSDAATYQTVLRSVTFAATAVGSGSRTITFSAADAAIAGSASRNILVASSSASNPVVWDGDSDADGDGVTWSDPLNWQGDVAPDNNDIAVFNGLDAGVVNVTSNVTIGGITFSNSAPASPAYVINSTGGNLTLTVGAVTQSGAINNTINAGLAMLSPATAITFDVVSTTTLTVNGVISGIGDVNKISNGTLVLSGVNTYTGGTNINAGTVRLSGGLAVPTAPSGAAGIYTFDSVSGTTVNNQGSLGATQNGTYVNGAATGAGKVGNGMSVPNTNAMMQIANRITTPSGVYTAAAWFNGLYSNASWRTLFRGSDSGYTGDHQIIIESGSFRLGFYGNNAGGGFNPLSPNYDVNDPLHDITTGWHHLAVVANGSSSTVYIDGVSVGTVAKASVTDFFAIGNYNGGGQSFANLIDEVYIYNTALSAAQVTTLYNSGAGIVQASSTNPIPDTSTVTIAPSATLDLNGFSESIGALAGGGTVTSGFALPVTLTTGANNASTTFSGVIQNGAGVLSLVKTGSGTMTLSGANTYGGSTNIDNGTIQLAGGADRLPTGTLLTTGAGGTGGTLDLNSQNQTVTGLASVGAGANRVINSSGGASLLTISNGLGATFAGSIGIAGQANISILKSGAGTQTLTGTSAFTGTTTILGGVLAVNSDAALGAAPGGFTANNINIANGATLNSTTSFTLNANRGITLGSGGGIINTNTNTALTYGGRFSGGTGLTKAGAGDLLLTNTAGGNTPGTIGIGAGRLFFDSLNSLGSGTIGVAGGATLDYRTGGALNLTNPLALANGANVASRGTSLTLSNIIASPTTGTLIVNQDDQNTQTVIVPANILLGGAITLQVGGGGGNGGVAQLTGVISGSAPVTKTGNGVLHLVNGGNNFTSTLNVNAGTLRVSADGALGSTAGATKIASGATLEFNGSFNYTVAETIYIAGQGMGGVGAVNKAGGGAVTLSAPITVISSAAIGSSTGNTLTIASNTVLASSLTFTGGGDINVTGNLSLPPASSILNLNNLATGDYSFTAASQTFNARVDNVAGTGWLLVGRGRQGWEFDSDGQGTISSVNQNLGTPAAFTPAAYSEAIINDLMTQSGLALTNVEIRIKRAEDAAGTSYQESRWVATSQPTWSWMFNDAGQFNVNYSIVAGTDAGYTANTNTHDNCCSPNNGPGRIFTWAWDQHNFQKGFSYGGSVTNGANNGTSFLWENGAEDHAIPYTEVYIRSFAPASGPPTVTKIGTGTVTLSGNNTYAGVTSVNAGALVVASPNALGTTAAGVVVGPGATLGFSGGVTLTGEAITAGGTGAAGQPGAIANVSGSNTIASPISASGIELRIGSTAGTLTVAGNVDIKSASLSFNGAGNVAVSGNIVQGAPLPLFGVTAELEIWLDATDINANGTPTSNGASVTNWKDKSGKNRNFDSVLGTPTYVSSSTHGLPAVNFDGSSALRTNLTNNNPRNFIDGNGEFTLISVARYSGADRERVVAAVTGHNWLFGFHGGSTDRNGHYDGWGSLDPIGFINDTNWHLHANQMNVFSDANDPAGDWWRDGVLVTNDSRGTGDAFGNNVPDGLSLGAWNGLGESSTSEVSELLMFNRVLSDLELGLIQSYLNAKYNLGFPVAPVPPATVTKLGSGTVTLSGNNTYTSPVVVSAGTLVAASASALGTTAGGVTVASSGTLGLSGGITVSGEALNINGTGAAGQPGALVNVSGNNTIAAGTTITVADVSSGSVGIGSVNDPGTAFVDTLTINTNLDLRFSRLTVDGSGNVVMNGNIVATSNFTVPNLGVMNGFATGDYSFTSAGQTFNGRIDNVSGTGWFLVGRGREGWQFDDDGQGTTASVNTGLGTPAAFAPAAYSEAIINGLLSQAGISMTNAEIRIRRAQDNTGTAYQEARWRPVSNTTWEWNFTNLGSDQFNGGFQVNYNIVSGLDAPFAQNGVFTHDNCCTPDNGPGRIFTSAWSSHNNQRGFSYGSTMNTGTNNASDFLWEFGNEDHAIPYTEIYVRPLTPTVFTSDNQLVKNGAGRLTLAGTNTYSGITTVNGGTLHVNSTLPAGGGAVTVNNTGTLGGTGTVNRNVTVSGGGTVNPGVTAGVLNAGTVNFSSGANFAVDIAGLAPQHDQLHTTSSVNLAGANLQIDLTGAYLPASVGDTFVILKNDGAGAPGTFNGIAENASIFGDGATFRVSYIYNADTNTPGTGNDVALINDSPSVQFTSANFIDDEGVGTTMVVTLSRTGNTTFATDVQVAITGGSAIGGLALPADYLTTGFPATVHFNAGAATASFPITLFDDANVTDPGKTIVFTVTAASNAVIGAQNTTTFTIDDNDNSIPVITPISVLDFNANNGGFTVVNNGPVEDPWTYNSGAGTWLTNGTQNQGVPSNSELNSAAFTVPGGPMSLSFDHRYSFEFDGTRWDGGQVRLSVNGGPWTPVTSFSQNGYVGVITGNNILNGQQAFNGDSAGYGSGSFITSVADLGTFAAGDIVRIQFVGAWDEFAEGSNPNWEIDAVRIVGQPGGAVSEDGILIAKGIIAIVDADPGESSYQSPSGLTGTYGSFTFNTTTGDWVYILDNASPLVQALAAGQTVSDSFTATSFDGAGSATVTVTISGTNDAPTIAVNTYDFTANGGGFTVVNNGPVEDPWMYNSGAGTWFTNGTQAQGTPSNSELNSANLTAAGGPVSLSFDHRYSFEFDGTRWDGGQVRLSVNGGPFTPVTSFSQNGYDGIITGNHVLTGQSGFNGDSAGYGGGAFVTSVANLGTFAPGDILRIQFVGAWDEFAEGTNPNWEITAVRVTGTVLSTTITVNEGDTVALSGVYGDVDAGANVAITATVAGNPVGTVNKTGTGSGTWTWSYPTTNGPSQSGTLTLAANDGLGGVASTTYTLVVNNVAPAYTLPASVSLTLGDSGVFNHGPVTFTDPGADVWTGTVNYGDGTGTNPLTVNQGLKQFSLAHAYQFGGTYTVTVTIDDQDGGVTVHTMIVDVPSPTQTYADDAWVGFANGTAILDADPVAAGNQSAVYGYDAFASPDTAAFAVAALGTVTVNAGTYAETMSVDKQATVNFQEGAISIDSLITTVGTATLNLNGITLTLGAGFVTSTVAGTGSLTKVGPGTLTFAGAVANTYAGTTRVNDGVLALAKTAGESVVGPIVIGDTIGGSANVKTAILRVDTDNQIADASSINFLGDDGRLHIATGATETITNPASLANGNIKVGGTLNLSAAFTQTAGSSVTMAGGTLRVGSAGIDDYSLAGVLQGSGTIYTKILTSNGTIDPSSGVTDADIGNASPGRITIRGNLQLTGSSVTNLDVGVSSDQLNVGINTALPLPAGSYVNLSNYDLDPYLRGDVPAVTEPGRRGVNDLYNINGTVRLDGTLNMRPINGFTPVNNGTVTSMNFVWRALNLPTGNLDPRGANLSSVPSDFAFKNSFTAAGALVAPNAAPGNTRFEARFMGSGGQANAIGQSVSAVTKQGINDVAILTAPAYVVGQAKSLTLTPLTAPSFSAPNLKMTKQLWNAMKDSHTRVTVTVTNSTGSALTGPFYLEITSTPGNVAVFNQAGKTQTNKPYLVVVPRDAAGNALSTLANGATATVEVDLLTPLILGKNTAITANVLFGGLP